MLWAHRCWIRSEPERLLLGAVMSISIPEEIGGTMALDRLRKTTKLIELPPRRKYLVLVGPYPFLGTNSKQVVRETSN
jgi:hypothetical protein